jgi:hypothetical protein
VYIRYENKYRKWKVRGAVATYANSVTRRSRLVLGWVTANEG